MRLTIYAELDVFEKVLLFQEEYPNWNFLFKYHSDLCLNISDKDYETLFNENNEILKAYIAITGGREPIPLKDFFTEIYESPIETLEDQPRNIFFLNFSSSEALELSNNIGVMVLPANSYHDKVLHLRYYKDVEENQILERETNLGWHELFGLDARPINSMILIDEYIFENTQTVKKELVNIGEENLIQLLDRVLPEKLIVPFHFTLITLFSCEAEESLLINSQRVIERIKTLRGYEVLCEFVYQKSDFFHKRKLIINYSNGTCDKGFSVFNPSNMKQVRKINSFELIQWFNSVLDTKGDLAFQSSTFSLKIIKGFVQGLFEGKNQGFVFGDSYPTKTLKNRLVNSV